MEVSNSQKSFKPRGGAGLHNPVSMLRKQADYCSDHAVRSPQPLLGMDVPIEECWRIQGRRIRPIG